MPAKTMKKTEKPEVKKNDNEVKENQTFTTKEPEVTKNTTMVDDIKKK